MSERPRHYPDKPHAINCATHGRVRWHGDVICSGCGAFYQTQAEKGPRFAPPECACGRRLMPDQATPKVEFSGRAICRTCFTRLCMGAKKAPPGAGAGSGVR